MKQAEGDGGRCRGLQPARCDLQSLPHGHVLDAFLDPMRLGCDLDVVALVAQLLAKAMPLPHALELDLGMYHDQALPREGTSSIGPLESCQLASSRGGRDVYGVGLLDSEVEDRVDEQLAEAELAVGLQDGEAAQLDVRLSDVVGRVVGRGVCVGMRVSGGIGVVEVLVRAVGGRDEADGAHWEPLGGGRGAPRVVGRGVARVVAGDHGLGRRRRGCAHRGVDDPVPAAGVVVVELGFQRHALLAVHLLAHRHGVLEDERHAVRRLLVPRLGPVPAVHIALGRGQCGHELGAAVGSEAVGDAVGLLRRRPAVGEGAVRGHLVASVVGLRSRQRRGRHVGWDGSRRGGGARDGCSGGAGLSTKAINHGRGRGRLTTKARLSTKVLVPIGRDGGSQRGT